MNIGDKAPEILGKDEQGRDIRLSDYKGRKLVPTFYPSVHLRRIRGEIGAVQVYLFVPYVDQRTVIISLNNVEVIAASTLLYDDVRDEKR